jgi:arginyl-tRNA synthetase
MSERAEFLGKAYMEGNKLYEESEEAKEEIHKINEALYKGEDTKLMNLYKETRTWSLEYFDYIYKRVDTKFDRLYFESEVADDGYKLSKQALEKGILKESEGAVIFPGNEYGLHDRVFITQRDVLTYEGKDMGLAKLQFKEFNPDLLIHLVGPEQTDYFKVVFKALELILPEAVGREKHLSYGWVRLKEGKIPGRAMFRNWLWMRCQISLRSMIRSETAEKVGWGGYIPFKIVSIRKLLLH